MKINTFEVFGWTATSISIILYFTPMIEYIKLCKGQIRYNDTPNLKVLFNYITCINWLIYAYLLKNKHILICYLSGSVLSFICVITFLLFLAKIKLLKSFLFTFILLAYTLMCYLLFALLIKNFDVLGYICVFFSLLLLVYPFIILKKAIKYRNYKYIPIKLCLLSLVGTACWIIYGFMIINFHVIIPNFIGMVFTLIIMFIWNIFKKRKPIAEEVANYSMNGSRSKPEQAVTIT